MKTRINMEFIIDTQILELTDSNAKTKNIQLVFDEESIMKILFRFSSSDPFAVLDVDNNSYMIRLGFDKDDNTQMTFLLIRDSHGINYMISNYPDFIMDLVDAFIQLHSIGKISTLLASTIKMKSSDDNIEETDYNNIPDEFELPSIEDKDNEDYYDTEYKDEEYDLPFDGKDTDYSESNDF